MKIKSILTKPFVLLFFSAVLSAVPLTFGSFFALSWVSFVPLFYVIITNSDDKFGRALGRGFLFGLFYHLCIYYWFLWFYPLDYVNLTKSSSIAVIALAWFGISAVHGALWCIPFLCCHFAKKLSKNSAFLSLVAIIGIIAAQKLTSLGELSFPWTRISLGQYKASALIQSASLWGAEGVDVLILTINALITAAIVSTNKKRLVILSTAVIVFCANLAYGLITLNKPSAYDDFTIMTVQAAVPQDKKWEADGDKICLNAYSTLTKKNITEDVDLVIWPESAVPKTYKSASSLSNYKKLSKAIDTPLLAGILIKTKNGNTNNAVLINDNKTVSIYTKRQMVPFGEYMPYKNILSKTFPMLTELNIIEDDYVAGQDTAIINTQNANLGSIICFESIYPNLTRHSVLDGANLLVEITNDSWLKDSPAMYQHLSHGVFRSIENGRYLIRSANSGISAVIDNKGRVKSELGINEQGAVTDTVQLIENQTLYTKTGDVLFPIGCAVILIWSVILFIKRKKPTD